MTTIDSTRLAEVTARDIGHGAHFSLDDGLCVMEAVAYVAGEPWSDHPKCACPVLGAFMRAWNDGLPTDEDRTRLLRPWVERLVGTKSTKAVEQRRADMALDWFVRVYAPAWLDLSEALSSHARAIRALPPLHSTAACLSAQPVLAAAAQSTAAAWAARDAARAAAWAAAWVAAWDAARDAAWDAARAAAWDATRAAARAAARAATRAAARDAARDAARAAAWVAAWDAARDATWDAVQNIDISGLTPGQAAEAARAACVALVAPTRDTLQRSALELLAAMVAVTPETLSAGR